MKVDSSLVIVMVYHQDQKLYGDLIQIVEHKFLVLQCVMALCLEHWEP